MSLVRLRELSGWLTALLQCFDTAGWVIRPVKISSPKWPVWCRLGRVDLLLSHFSTEDNLVPPAFFSCLTSCRRRLCLACIFVVQVVNSECCVCLLYSLTRQWQDEKVTHSKELSEAAAKQQVIICLLIVLILTNVLCLLLSLRWWILITVKLV